MNKEQPLVFPRAGHPTTLRCDAVCGGGIWEGTMILALLFASSQSLPPLPTIKLGPSSADSQVGELVYILGPCGSLQLALLWGWEFLPLLPQPPQVFSIRGLRPYFPLLEPRVVWSVSVLLPRCSSQFICTWMWDHLVHNSPPRWVCQPQPCPALVLQPLSCHESSLPSCPSPPLLPVWMNVSSLTPWLSDFHTVRFSVHSGCFLF